MSNLQEVFLRLRKIRDEQKKIKSAYRDALSNTPSYHEVVDELVELKERKQQIEKAVQAQFSSEFIRLNDLKIDLESDTEMLSDLALNQLVKGEAIKVKDEFEVEYEPLFTVKFKKTT